MKEVDQDLKLSIPGYEFDNVDDLGELDQLTVKSFALRSSTGRINLSLGEGTASLSVDDPDLATRGMASEIERLLRTRRRFVSTHKRVLTFSAFLAVYALLPLSVGLAVFDGNRAEFVEELGGTPGLVGVAILVLTSGIVMSSFMSRTLHRDSKGSAVIYTRSREEAPPWIQRNKDNLISNTIVGFVFLIVGIIVGYTLPG